jgi:hypothetical protein
MALVVQITALISRSNCRNGTNSAQAFSQSRVMAGYRFSHLPLNSANAPSAAASDGAVYTGLRSLASWGQSRFDAYLKLFLSR